MLFYSKTKIWESQVCSDKNIQAEIIPKNTIGERISLTARFLPHWWAYMHSKGMKPVYLMIDKHNNLKHDFIVCDELFGIDPLSDDAFYNFEAGYSAYEKFYTGDREKTDLVMINRKTNENLRGFEIKLTALPDNTTKKLNEDKYSCEIVMRPPTICFLACSICEAYEKRQKQAARTFKGSATNKPLGGR